MTGTERKRQWRMKNPERSRAAEARRARLRYNGGEYVDGKWIPCASSESYARYEYGFKRAKSRIILGIKAHIRTFIRLGGDVAELGEAAKPYIRAVVEGA